MALAYETIAQFFEQISKRLDTPVTVHVIGGAVLVYQGLKPGTKDIDMIVETKKEFCALQRALKKDGFIPHIPGQDYARMNVSQVFQRGEVRIDLFERQVCGRFSLSKGMKQRGRRIQAINGLAVMHCANEDIFLFKTMTEREGDLDDCMSLARTDMDWGEMLREIRSQIRESEQEVWITWIGERMDQLREKGMVIPIMPEIDRLRRQFFDELQRKQSQ